MKTNKKYHYFYKITNLINEHYYYGIHSTNNLNDGYMGSGVRLNKAYKKYGVENFNKEILKFFDSRKEASDYEAEVVSEKLVEDNNCYNSIIGGELYNKVNSFYVFNNKKNIWECVTREYYYNNKNDYSHASANKVVIKNKDNNKYELIDSYQYKKLKEQGIRLETPTTNHIPVKDKNGANYLVSTDDERYISGELVPIWKDRKHTEETKNKISEAHKLNKYQEGEKNSQYGTCWVYNEEGNLKIKKEELEEYLNKGYKKGRKLNIDTDKVSFIDKDKVISLRKKGILWKEIYKILNVSESTMYKFRKRNKDIQF